MNFQEAVSAGWTKVQDMMSSAIIMLPNIVLALIVFLVFWFVARGFGFQSDALPEDTAMQGI